MCGPAKRSLIKRIEYAHYKLVFPPEICKQSQVVLVRVDSAVEPPSTQIFQMIAEIKPSFTGAV